VRGTKSDGEINVRNGSGNIKETDGKSNVVLDKGDRKGSLKENTERDMRNGFLTHIIKYCGLSPRKGRQRSIFRDKYLKR
jgi:hypothetical protein